MSKRNTYITGILRTDRKRNPSQVVGKKLWKGEMVFMSLGDISIYKWKDKRDVCVISKAHVLTMIGSINRHYKSKRKPNVVHIYNNHMSGVDRSDQMLSYHSALQKTIRWYKRQSSKSSLNIIYLVESTEKKEKCCQNMQTLFHELEASRIKVWVPVLSQ